MAEIRLEYVNSFIDARGKRRHVFRRKGHKRVTLKGRPGSAEFMDHYHQLLELTGGTPSPQIGGNNAKAGTVNALAVALYKHDIFTKGLAKASQNTWRRIIDRFREFKTPSGRLYGENSISTIQKKSVLAFLEGKTANAAKNNLKAVRFLIRFAISQGQLAHDPTEGIELLKATASMGHMTWLEPQVEQYRQHHQLGTVARLAIELLLNIAARRHDAHVIGQQHIKNGKLVWRPHKTQRTTGKSLSIRVMPELQAALDAIPEGTRADGEMTFLVTDYGRAFASAAALGNKFGDWCRAAGLKPVVCDDGKTRNYRAHGLRKTALRTLAHAGATGVELMAVSGHASLDQVQEYLNEVDQERAADSAMAKLSPANR
jgi:integrase